MARFEGSGFLWWRYPYRVGEGGAFVVPASRSTPRRIKALLLAQHRNLHIALADVRTEDAAQRFVGLYGVPIVREGGDWFHPGYTVQDLLTDAARMRAALTLASILRGPGATHRLKLNEFLDSSLLKRALGDDPHAQRAVRYYLAPRMDKIPAKLKVPDQWRHDEWHSDLMRSRLKEQWGVGDRRDRSIGEVNDLLLTLMHRALAGRLPRLEASLEPSLKEGAVVWRPASLLDVCWLHFLRAMVGAKLPKLCPCGTWHERQGIYCSSGCRSRWKARRHYERERRARRRGLRANKQLS